MPAVTMATGWGGGEGTSAGPWSPSELAIDEVKGPVATG